MSFSKQLIIDRVNSGVAYLNDQFPKWAEEASTNGNINWLDMFKHMQYQDIQQFDIDDPDRCVLGLLIKWVGYTHENFYDMRRNLNLSFEQCTEYGFYFDMTMTLDDHIEYGYQLTLQWVKKLDELIRK